MASIIEKDDVNELQKILCNPHFTTKISIHCQITPINNETIFISSLNYSIATKSMKCFKFLLLNGANHLDSVSTKTLNSRLDGLAFAVMVGQWEMFKILSELNLDSLKAPGVWEITCLTHRNKFLKHLITNTKDDPDQENLLNIGLIGSILGHNLSALKLLLAEEADINFTDDRGLTPIHYAVQLDDIEITKILISNGANVNNSNAESKFETPLHLAILNNNLEMVIFLILQNADVNSKNIASETSLHYAVTQNNSDIVKILIINGAKVNEKNSCNQTPLFWAVYFNNVEIANFLILNGADINLKDCYAQNLLHFAAIKESVDAAKLIISKNPSMVNSKDIDGLTPLHLTAQFNSFKTAELLIENQAELNSINEKGQTALHLAAKFNSLEVLELLILSGGLDVNTKDYQDHTPLHIAVAFDNIEIASFLLLHGADSDIKDFNNLSPKGYAKPNSNVKSLFYQS